MNFLNLKAYIIAPIIEEVYFRFILLLVLDNDLKHKYFYLFISSLLFSLAHCHKLLRFNYKELKLIFF